MKKLIIEFDETKLIITDLNQIIREYSQVPSKRDGNEMFNKLREVAKEEWFTKVCSMVYKTMCDKTRE